jgi:hypothetical protein
MLFFTVQHLQPERQQLKLSDSQAVPADYFDYISLYISVANPGRRAV